MRAILVLVCLAAAGSAQARPGQESAAARPIAWVEAVRTHVPGKADAALAAIAARDQTRIRKEASRAPLDDVDFLTRALVLHTDIAIVEDASQQTGLDRGATILLEDGRDTGRRAPSEHWPLALTFAKLLGRREEPAGPRIALRWFHAVTALHQLTADCTLVDRHVEEGLLRWPDDATLHLYRGTLHQTYADERIQQFVRRRNDARPPVFVRREIGRGVSPSAPNAPTAGVWERQLAEASLRRALFFDPTLQEARIRLAHVIGDRGKVDEAVALAETALATPLPPFFEIYAALILGRNQARAGRFEAARAAFERAAALAPDSQAPRIGLAQVALAQRRAGDAHAGLAAALAPSRSDEATNVDPWLVYFRIHEPEADALLSALRAEVR